MPASYGVPLPLVFRTPSVTVMVPSSSCRSCRRALIQADFPEHDVPEIPTFWLSMVQPRNAT